MAQLKEWSDTMIPDYRALKMLFAAVLVVISIALTGDQSVYAQTPVERRPVDMMILIDNSCSMFPSSARITCCDVWGNDPGYLRITGADLFLARLGFAEAGEEDYQAGVISIGSPSRIVSPLQPLAKIRDTIASVIAAPKPECATQIVDGLELAYKELRESPTRRPTNLPAIVLITDGIPYPRASQSDEMLEELIAANPDIPVFIMLLQNRTDSTGSYEEYINFWTGLQAKRESVFAYRIRDAKQIENTYNAILAQLQSTIPTEGIEVTPDEPLAVYVSRYVQRIVITVVHRSADAASVIGIKDPKGTAVDREQPGVKWFRGAANPTEVISIGRPRLNESLKDDIWTITSSEAVTVFLDRLGAYRINFVSPTVGLTDITSVYLATDRQPPEKDIVIRFNLLDEEGRAVADAQPIQGVVILPDGKEALLAISAKIEPDAAGAYEIRYNPAANYPQVGDTPGRFSFVINAGSADDAAPKRLPIASARLLVNVGRGPYVDSVEPEPLVCKAGEPAPIKVRVGDITSAVPDSVNVRVFGEEDMDLTLTQSEPGVFTGDLASLCDKPISRLSCLGSAATTFRLRLVAQLVGGAASPAIDRILPTDLVAPACTPTPEPTATSTPLPTPTPVPDTDTDGVDDLKDECVETPQWSIAPSWNGCPPPWYVLVLGGLASLGLVLLIVLWLIPWLKVLISPPPKGYVLVCRQGERGASPHSVYSIGMGRRTNRVVIGSDPKRAHLVVRGLKAAEFEVIKDSEKVILRSIDTSATRNFEGATQAIVSTSNPDITLRIGLDQSKLRC